MGKDFFMMTLDRLKPGESGVIVRIGQPHARLADLGFTEGTTVSCRFASPLGDPKAYEIRGAVIAVRKEDSSHIQIKAARP